MELSRCVSVCCSDGHPEAVRRPPRQRPAWPRGAAGGPRGGATGHQAGRQGDAGQRARREDQSESLS